MKKSVVENMVGKNVIVELYDKETIKGELCYVDDFSAKHGFRLTGLFYVKNTCWSFRAYQIRKIKEIEGKE